MPLTNTKLRYYDSNILRLPQDKRSQYHDQVDRLIDNLRRKLRDDADIIISRVVKAGSFAKHTILRKASDSPVDVDVVFYVDGSEVDSDTLDDLNALIYEILIGQYPTKSVEDFVIQRKAATVTFVGTGISVDVVPVIEDPNREGYGWQYDVNDGTKTETCAPCQIKFVRDRKDIDGDYRTLVRLAKKWRNRAELKPLKSFAIELIMAYLLDTRGSEGGIEQRFRDFLLYIAQSGLKDKIIFPENGSSTPSFADPVVIIDPVCNANNVTSRISEQERIEICEAAQTAWENAHYASAEDDYDVWKELFGPQFKTEESK